MNEFSWFASTWLLRTLAAGGALLLLTWVLLRFTGDPARRQRLAAWTFRGAVLAAILGFFPAWLTIPIPLSDPAPQVVPVRAKMVPKTEVAPESTIAATPSTPLAEPAANDELIFAVLPEDVPAPEWVPAAELAAAPPPAVATQAAPRDWLPLLLWAYGAIAALAILQLGLAVIALIRWRRRSVPAPARVLELAAELAAPLAVKPIVRISPRIQSPVCFGWRRPTVLLPQYLVESAKPDELRWALAHEFDHLRRGDPRTGLWVGLARAVYFVLPWFWAVRRELRLAQEYLADAAAAAGRSADYAAFLVSLSGLPARRGAPLGAVAVRAGRTDLYRRVSMLTQSSKSVKDGVSRAWSLLTAVGVLAAAVAFSGVGFADDKKPEKKIEVRIVDADGKKIAGENIDVEVIIVYENGKVIHSSGKKGDAKKPSGEAKVEFVIVDENGKVIKSGGSKADVKKPGGAADIEVVVVDQNGKVIHAGRKADGGKKPAGVSLPAKVKTAEGVQNVIIKGDVDVQGVTAPAKSNVKELTKALSAALEKGDVEGAKKLMVKLNAALAAAPAANTLGYRMALDAPRTALTPLVTPAVPGVRFTAPVAPLAPVAPAAPAFTRMRKVEAEDESVKKMEEKLASLRKALEQVKDSPEAREALEKTIAEFKKKIEDARKRGELKTEPVPQFRGNKAPDVERARDAEDVARLQAEHAKAAELMARKMAEAARADADATRKHVEDALRAAAKELEAAGKDNPEAAAKLKVLQSHMKDLQAQAEKQADEAKLRARGFLSAQGGEKLWAPKDGDPFKFAWSGAGGEGRMGVTIDEVPAALVDQFNLDKGVAVLITGVRDNSPAAKAGLKANDVLMVINGKQVPAQVEDVVKMVNGLKADEKFDIVVLRKGKKETIKDVVLPAVKMRVREVDETPKAKLRRDESDSGKEKKESKSNSMSVTVNDGEFTIKAEGDDGTYELAGTVDGADKKVTKVTITHDGEKKTYTSLDKLPKSDRAKIEELLKSVGGGRAK